MRGDYVLFVDPKKWEEDRTLRRLEKKYEGLQDLVKESNGQVDYVIKTAETTTRCHNSEQRSELLFSATYYRWSVKREEVLTLLQETAKLFSVHKEENYKLELVAG